MRRFFLIASLVFCGLYESVGQITPGFSANVLSGCPPRLILLIDSTESANPISIWNWTITGPETFTGTGTPTPSFIFTEPGLYTVTLVVCDNQGNCTPPLTKTDYIEIFALPTIDYVISPQVGCNPTEVCFTNNSDPGCGTIQNTFFDLNDGNIINTNNDFCHTYDISTIYSIDIEMTNSCGCSVDTTIDDIITIVDIPEADFVADQNFSCSTPLQVNFTDLSTSSNGSLNYEWYVGEVFFSSLSDPSRTFTTGTFDITLIVTDAFGCQDSVTFEDYIVVGEELADFEADTTVICPGGSITFNDLSNGDAIDWEWIVRGGQTVTGVQNPTITFNTPGTYDIILVTTFTGGCTDSLRIDDYIEVLNGPVAGFYGEDRINITCTFPVTVDFFDTSSGIGIIRRQWTLPGATPPGSNQVFPTASYNSYGSFDVTFFLSDINGCSSSVTVQDYIQILPIGQGNIVASPAIGCAPITSTMTLGAGFNEPIVSYQWDVESDGTIDGTGTDVTYTFPDTGCYSVSVIIETSSGCIDTVHNDDVVCAGSPASGSFTVSPATICFEAEPNIFSWTGDADSVIWDFGDRPGVTLTFPAGDVSYVYTDFGMFSPCATPVSNGCPGQPVCLTDAVDILAPAANFSYTNSCDSPRTWHFENLAAGATDFLWGFGENGVTSTVENPSYTYQNTDFHAVTLNVSSSVTGCNHSKTDTIRVIVPDADFAADDTVGCAAFTTTFRNTSEFRAGSASIRWDFDPSDGLNFNFINGEWGTNVTHTFQEPGIYSVAMQNIDPNGCIDTLIKWNYITVYGPDAFFSADTLFGCAPLTVPFHDLSTAFRSEIVGWIWDFGDGSPFDTTQNPVHTYDSGGVFSVALTAIDTFGCQHSWRSDSLIEIIVSDPKARFIPSNDFVCSDQPIFLENTSDGGGLVYQWQMPDGSITSSTAFEPTVSYSFQDSFIVELSVIDSIGCLDTTRRTIQVFDPIANFGLDTNFASCPSLLVNFSDSSLNNICDWFWDFGDSSFSNDVNPSHLYTEAGEYMVTLVVTSCSGCRDTIQKGPVTIAGARVRLEVAPLLGCPCLDVQIAIRSINMTDGFLLPGCGQPFVPVVPSSIGTFSNPTWDTIVLPYCDTCRYIPQILADNGAGCQVLWTSPDTVVVDTAVVQFGVDQGLLCDSGTICFSDSSIATVEGSFVSGWEWDFGDGSPIDTTPNPCHFYDAPGPYDVTLTAIINLGCRSSFTRRVYIPTSPVADFALINSPTCQADTLSFSDSTTTDDSTAIEFWQWNFGDNSPISQDQNPTHVYVDTGTFLITMVVVDSLTCTDTLTRPIEIHRNPRTTAEPDDTLCFGENVQLLATGGETYQWSPGLSLNDSLSDSPVASPGLTTEYFVTVTDSNLCDTEDSLFIKVNRPFPAFTADTVCLLDTTRFTNLSSNIGGINVSFTWDFGDPASGGSNSSTLENPVHVFTAPGGYSVTLVVVDDNGCTDDTTVNVLVAPLPIARFINDSVCVGDSTHFNDASVPGVGVLIDWQWTFGDGASSTVPDPVHLYDTAGFYTVCLSVTNSSDCAGTDDTCIVVVVYENPTADFAIDSACLGDSLRLQDLSSNPGWSAISQWNWDFGDPLVSSDTSSAQNPAWLYDSPGNYTVQLSIGDTNSCVNDTQHEVSVLVLPIASFTSDSICFGDTLLVNDQSTPGNLPITNWQWTFGSGQLNDTLNTQNAGFVYTSSDTFDVSFTVADDFGCTDDTLNSTIVYEIPRAQFTYDSICFGDSTHFIDRSTPIGEAGGWSWDFDDGTVSSLQNPVHLFDQCGTYNVRLSVSNPVGCDHDTVIAVIVYCLPQPNFSFDTVCFGNSTPFTDRTQNGDGQLSTFNWSFGDVSGGTSVDQNPSYQYQTADSFTVTLAVTDEFGCFADTQITSWVAALPVANFQSDSLCQRDTMYFADSSRNGLGTINNWSWDFGTSASGGTSASQNSSFVYPDTGTFIVSLQVTDQYGCTDDTARPALISAIPKANFSAAPVCLRDTTNFIDLSNANTGQITDWSWNFGDQDSSAQSDPDHLYQTPQTYPVRLEVANTIGCSHDTIIPVTVYVLPEANFQFDTVCFGDQTSLFDATVPGDGNLTGFDWNFGDNTNDTVQNPVHTYPNDTSYQVILNVLDDNGCADDTSIQLWVASIPVASFPRDTFCVFDSAQLTDASIAGFGTLDFWGWNFGSGQANDSSNAQFPAHIYTQSGSYDVRLHVSDNFGCSDDTINQIFVVALPIADFNFVEDCEGNATRFNDASSSVHGTVDSWSWNFGDGDTSDVQNPNHTYNSDGIYTVDLSVLSSFGCFSDTSRPVQVYTLPTAAFSNDTVCLGSATTFIDLSFDGTGSINQHQWNFGNAAPGDSSTVVNPLYQYATDGIYTVNLTVTDDLGCAHDTAMQVWVYTLPVANFETSATCTGTPVDFIDLSQEGSNTLNSWSWNFDDGPGGFSQDQNPIYLFVNTGAHAVSLSITDAAGCVDDTVVNIFVHPKPIAEFSPDQNPVCFGEPICFDDESTSGGNPLGLQSTWVWDIDNNGSQDYSAQNICHTYPTDGVFSVRLLVIDSNQCEDSVVHDVRVFALPEANFDWTTSCENTPTPFTDLSTEGDAPIVDWLYDFGDNSSLNQQSPGHIYADSGWYDVSLSVTDANGCSDSVLIPVLVEWEPTLFIDPGDTTICFGTSVLMNATGASDYVWSPPIWLDNPFGSSVLITPETTITYTLTGSNEPCQEVQTEIIVTVIPLSEVSVSASQNPIIQGSSTTLSATIRGTVDSLTWSPTNTLSCRTCIRPTASPLETTTYYAELHYGVNDVSCSKADSITIEVLTECTGEIAFLPNSFTPNNDGTNDIIYPRSFAIELVKYFRVFDRWGKLLHETTDFEPNDPKYGWDGTNMNGNKMNAAVYVYVLDMVCANGDPVLKKGTINLLK